MDVLIVITIIAFLLILAAAIQRLVRFCSKKITVYEYKTIEDSEGNRYDFVVDHNTYTKEKEEK